MKNLSSNVFSKLLAMSALTLSAAIALAERPRDNTAETHIFSETTSFEALARKYPEGGRAPASTLIGNLRVIAVRREFALTELEAKKAPQDIIINGGTEEGLSEGQSLRVVRKVPIIDPFLDNQQRELEIPFAQVTILHTQDNLAIARIEKLDPINSGAAVGVRGVLIGDYLTTRLK